MPKKTPMEESHVLHKDNENSFEPLTIIGETNFDENTESGKGTTSMSQPKNEINLPTHPNPRGPDSKERGNQEVT